MEDELTCPVCLELFADPLLLPCSHSVCKACILDIIDSKKSKTDQQPMVECPNCRKDVSVSAETIRTLPRNLALENVVFRFQEEYSKLLTKSPGASVSDKAYNSGMTSHVSPREVADGFPVEHNKVCELCEGGQPCRAAWYCEQCKVTYCHPCLDKFHPKRGSLVRHHIRQPSEAEDCDNASYCMDHVKENTSIYCWQCKMFVCHLCVCETVGKHFGHHILESGDALLKIKEILSTYRRDINDIKASNSELKGRLEEVNIETKETYQDSCERIEQQYKRILSDLSHVLDIQKESSLQSVLASYSSISDMATKQIEILRERSMDLEQAAGRCDTKEDGASDILRKGHQVQDIKKYIQQGLETMQELEAEYQQLLQVKTSNLGNVQSGSKTFEYGATDLLKTVLDVNEDSCIPVIPHIQSPATCKSPTNKVDMHRVQNKYLITWGFTMTTFTAEEITQNSTWSVTIEKNSAGHCGNVGNGYLFGVGIASGILNFKDSVGRNERSIGVICENGTLYFSDHNKHKETLMPLGTLPISVSLSVVSHVPLGVTLVYKISASQREEVLTGKWLVTDKLKTNTIYPVFTVNQRVKMVFPTFV